MTRYRQTIVYGAGDREYTQVWLWHPARIVAARLRQELRSSYRPVRTILEQERRGVIYDSEGPR